MREAIAIVEAFEALVREGTPCAMATVVAVSGSSYRRPGARLLATADGRSWGGVSGGCLERDVLRQLRAMAAGGEPRIVRYDTSEDDADFGSSGVALGCQGLIDILLEPLSAERAGVVPYLRRAVVDRVAVRVATVIASRDPARPVGMRGEAGEGAGVTVFAEQLLPPQALVVFGSGPDVLPVVALAKTLGWHVTVVGVQATSAILQTADRFVRSIEEALIDEGTAIVLMTHNYPRDLEMLPGLIARQPAYLGILGPRRRAERLVLEAVGVPADALRQIHAPVGLDIGATTPETIALSIVAEIQAVLARRPQTSLRDRPGPIYPETHDGEDRGYHPTSCPISA